MNSINRWVWASLIVTLVVASGCSSSNNRRGGGVGTTGVMGSGVLAQEDRPVGGFSGLVMSAIGDVHITVGGAESLRVEAEDNLLQHIETFVQGGSLVIQIEQNIDIDPTLPIEFHVTVTSLDNIVLSGLGNIDAAGLNANQFTVTQSGFGSIEMTGLNATDLVVTLAGVGGLRISGQVDSQTVTMSGAGSYDAEDLQSDTAVVVVNTFGSATVRVSTTLTVTVSAFGSVFYIGDPTVTVSGPGTVQKIG
jgi:hypothetical protein